MRSRPSEALEAGRQFYSRLIPGLDVSHFAPMWHLVTLGHLVLSDLDRIAATHGLSTADLLLLGTLRIDRVEPMRAVDLARILGVTPPVLTARVRRLAQRRLLTRESDRYDRRASRLQVTDEGSGLIETAIAEIAETSAFVQAFRRLEPNEREALGGLLSRFHGEIDRIMPDAG